MASLQHAMRGIGVTEPCTRSYDTTLILDQANTPENRGLCAHSHPHIGQTIKKAHVIIHMPKPTRQKHTCLHVNCEAVRAPGGILGEESQTCSDMLR